MCSEERQSGPRQHTANAAKSAISSKDLNYLRNIHIMRRIFLVISVDYFFGDILDRKLLLKEFPANESVSRFLKRDTFVEITVVLFLRSP